ncbi:MAG TPA: hypothetical protein VLG12_00770, partial [Candidatus Saccharimonadales bacterium]|nr:hypothetical protein [Candidatus Saccharimonadales bacterium]
MNFDLRSLPLRDLVIGGILLLVVGNLVYLDIKTAVRVITPTVLPSVTQTPITQNNTNITITPAASVTPPCASCPAQINTAMSLIQNIQAALSITPKPTLSPTMTPVSSSSGLLVKEYFIPMGLGYGQSADWTDVPGVKATIDTSLYPAMKQVTVEFTGYTPTGNQVVYARLYNDTDSHAIPSSDLTWSGGGYQSFITPALTLDSG